MKTKKIIAIVIIAIILAMVLPLESIAKSFDLNINFDGKNISMESETTDMSWNLNNLLPGQSDTSTVSIKNSGSGPVVLETEISIEEDSGLLEMIDLKVTNKKGEEVYTGKYTEMQTIETPLGVGDTETFTVETSLNVNAGNEYQNKQYKLKFNFNATGTELYGTLTVRYVDENGTDLIPATVDTKSINDTYDYTNETAKDLSYLGYEFSGTVTTTKSDGKLSGNYEINGTEIVYHYDRLGKVSAKWVVDDEIDEATGKNKVLKSFEDIKKVGTEYSFEAENYENIGYKYTGKVDGNPSGKYAKDPTEIIFHYTKNSPEEPPVKESGKVIILYVDENKTEISRQEDTGVVGDSYSYAKEDVVKNIPGYKFIAIEGALTGEYKKEDTIIYCKYESIKNGNLIVVCIDENNNIIKRTVTTREIGTDYNLGKVGEEIPGYEFLGVDGDTVGKYKEEDTIVTYRYKSIKQGPSTNVVSKPKTGDTVIKYIAIVAGAVIILLIVVKK